MRRRLRVLFFLFFLCLTAAPLAAHTHETYHTSGTVAPWFWFLLAAYGQITVAVWWSWLLGKSTLGSVVLSLVLTQGVGDITQATGIASVEFVLPAPADKSDVALSDSAVPGVQEGYCVEAAPVRLLRFFPVTDWNARAPPGWMA